MSRRDILLFKNLENLTLARDTELSRLEKAVKRYRHGSYGEEVLLLVGELRRSRKALMKVMEDLRSVDVGDDILEYIEALVEFNDLVAVPREKDLIERLIKGIEAKGAFKEVRKLRRDIEELDKLGAIIKGVLQRF